MALLQSVLLDLAVSHTTSSMNGSNKDKILSYCSCKYALPEVITMTYESECLLKEGLKEKKVGKKLH